MKPDEFRFFVQTVESAFSPDVVVEASGIRYGWRPDMGGERVLAPYTRIEPAAWVLSAVSLLHSRQSDVPAALRAKARSMVEYTQDVLMLYRSGDSGGWNVFPHQTNPDDQSTYGSAAVLIGLLDLAEADLPWLGSRERRDELILATTDWLLRRFEKSEGRAGWRASPGDPRSQRSDGLTLMIYSGLLREERLTGRPLPPEIVSELPKFLSYAVEQGPRGGQWSVFVETREFRNHLGVLTVADERTHVLWYPWALECARGWLERVKRVGGTRAELTQARRHLSRLVVDLGEAMVAEARDGDLTFVISETLYGLAPVGGQ
ncbi:MAG TPA: hypothetical protein VLT87_14725 [Thermoanaerobaculia bacterium]|nr:hypothetical protein [Thermoanaerobaculia bacterium]